MCPFFIVELVRHGGSSLRLNWSATADLRFASIELVELVKLVELVEHRQSTIDNRQSTINNFPVPRTIINCSE